MRILEIALIAGAAYLLFRNTGATADTWSGGGGYATPAPTPTPTPIPAPAPISAAAPTVNSGGGSSYNPSKGVRITSIAYTSPTDQVYGTYNKNGQGYSGLVPTPKLSGAALFSTFLK